MKGTALLMETKNISKIEFIKKHFPEWEKIDPRANQAFVNKVNEAMIACGIYKKNHFTNFNAVTNVILKMQGSYKMTSIKNKRLRKVDKP